MRKAAIFAGAFAVLIGWPSLSLAQVDFSGDWELVEGGPDSPLFRGAHVDQKGATLTIAPTPPQLLYENPRVFMLDGTETRYTHGTVRGDETWLLVSRATWKDGSLHIATATNAAATGRWDSQMTISFDAEGQLVIAKQEPTLTGGVATMRLVYRRKR